MILERNAETRALPQERRLNMRLMAYWWDNRGARRFPTICDFVPEELGDIWANCFTLRPAEPQEKSQFRYIGEMIAKFAGAQQSPATVDQVPPETLLDHATRNIGEVMGQKVPVIRSGSFLDPQGNTLVFRSILLPLSSDQETIDCLVGAARCKFVEPD